MYSSWQQTMLNAFRFCRLAMLELIDEESLRLFSGGMTLANLRRTLGFELQIFETHFKVSRARLLPEYANFGFWGLTIFGGNLGQSFHSKLI